VHLGNRALTCALAAGPPGPRPMCSAPGPPREPVPSSWWPAAHPASTIGLAVPGGTRTRTPRRRRGLSPWC